MRLLALSAFGLVTISPAQAFDCAKARAPIETAICADPSAKAADTEMVAAFESVRGGIEPSQRQALLEDQRAWLKERNMACQSHQAVAKCLSASNRTRTAMLLAKPETGPGIEPAPKPVFIRQAGNRTKVGVAVQLYRFAEPSKPGEVFFNKLADEAVAAITWKKDEPDDRDWSDEVSWSLAYASPTFISIHVQTWNYSGGAHGSTGAGGLNVDMRTGRALVFKELFDAKAADRIGKLCFDQVVAEKKEREIEVDDAKELRKQSDAVVTDMANWTFTETAASVQFDQYAVGAYAEGSFQCELQMTELTALSKTPLPPR